MPKRGKTEFSGNSIIVLMIVLLVLLIITDLGAYFIYTKNPSSSSSSKKAIVSQIIDGQTFTLESGEIVKMIGISAPSAGQPYFEESARFLDFLIKGKEVTLESDVQDADSLENLLRYVYVQYNNQQLFLNLESVAQGYSIPNPLSPNTKYRQDLDRARQSCLQTRLNLCGS